MMDARDITRALGGQWYGTYGLCPGPGHSQADRSMKVMDSWDGDIICCSFAGDGWRAFKDQLRNHGWLPPLQKGDRPESRKTHQGRAVLLRARGKPRLIRTNDTNPNVCAARMLWSTSKKPENTAVETYLRGRGITIPIPATIRYLRNAKHSGTRLLSPAMIAGVTVWPGKKVEAVHRTFLAADGTRKSQVTPNKMALGPAKGGAVRLAQVTEKLAVGEGIETMLSVSQATGLPSWAALGTAGLVNLKLPDLPLAAAITICADNDENEAGQKAAREAARRWHAEGRRVRIAVPPTAGMDFNDLLNLPENVVMLGTGR